MRLEAMCRLSAVFGLALLLPVVDAGAASTACYRADMRYSIGATACIMGTEARCVSRDGVSGWQKTGAGCDFRIGVSSAKYGSADFWCSAMGPVAHACNGRGSCVVSLPDIGTQWSTLDERRLMRRKLVCGPLNTVRKYLYIGWYCSDGDTALGQPEVALRDGERVVLSCDRSSVGDPSLE